MRKELTPIFDKKIPIHPSEVPPAALCIRCKSMPWLEFSNKRPVLWYYVLCSGNCWSRKAGGWTPRDAVRYWNRRQGFRQPIYNPKTGETYPDPRRRKRSRMSVEESEARTMNFRSRWRADRYGGTSSK